MKYKLVIFDFDGILVDLFEWFLGVVDEFVEKYKFWKFVCREFDEFCGSLVRKVLMYFGVVCWCFFVIGWYLYMFVVWDIGKILLFEGVD